MAGYGKRGMPVSECEFPYLDRSSAICLSWIDVYSVSAHQNTSEWIIHLTMKEIPSMSEQHKTFWESVDVALTVTLKLIVLGAFLLLALSLSFCSDEKVKQTSTWTIGRLELAGFRPTKVSLGIIELQAAATAATGVEAGNARGLAADLKRLASTPSIPTTASEQLIKLATEVEGYSRQLANRDKQLLSAVKTASTAPASDSGSVHAWIYLGRRSTTGEWAPMSDKITLNNNVSASEVKVTKDVVLVDSDPSLPQQAAGNSANDQASTIRLLRAGGDSLKILSVTESPSIGNGKLQWARVEVQPRDLYEVRR